MLALPAAMRLSTMMASAPEGHMIRSLNAPLSPHEEVTLRRVALGVASESDLPERDVARLRSLALVEGRAGRVRLTTTGRSRYESLRRASRPITGDDMPCMLATAFHKARQQ
jgi:hypothetical protein